MSPPDPIRKPYAHATKSNTVALAIICTLILILCMQIWLLTAALNESLDGNNAVKWPAFFASVFLFLSGVGIIRFLPDPLRRARRAAKEETRRGKNENA